MARTIIAAVFFALAVFIFFSEVVGFYKFRYVMSRMHAAALGDTLGILFVIIGVIILRGFSAASVKLIIIPLFMFLTGPVVTHLIGECEVLSYKPEHGEYSEVDRT